MSLNTSPAVPSPSKFEHHGPVARVLLAVIGGIFTASSAGVVTLIFFFAARDASLRRSLARDPFFVEPVAFLIVLLFVAIAAYGVGLVLRAIRGRSQRRFVHAQRWYLRHWYAITLVGCGVLAGVGVAVAGGPTAFLLSGGATPLRLYWFAFLGCLVLPIHVAIHELGHAAAGALVKFRFSMLRVGPLVLHRDTGRFRISWSPAGFTERLGHYRPVPEREEALGARLALVYAAGPLATLAFAAICCVGWMGLGPTSTLGSTVASELLCAGWWVGAYLGVINILPLTLRSGLVVTDGAHTLNALLSSSPAGKVALRFRLLTLQGHRPREWGMAAESILSAANDDRRHREVLLFAALAVALDIGDMVRVDEILRRVEEMRLSRKSLIHVEFELQAAMVEAFRGNSGLARERIDRLGPHPTIPDYPRLAEATVHLSEGRLTEARLALEAWHQALTKTGQAAAVRVGNEWAEEALRARLALVSEQQELSAPAHAPAT